MTWLDDILNLALSLDSCANDDYLAEIFQEFAEDNDTGALLVSLRVIAHVQGIGDMAEQIDMTRQEVQKALSDEGNP
jgi:HTH-type transcriptional regulator / antitoxin HigA